MPDSEPMQSPCRDHPRGRARDRGRAAPRAARAGGCAASDRGRGRACNPGAVGVYARIMRTPGVAAVVVATLVGRLPIGISGLAILLYVREVTGSFAAAGACAGALALGSACGAPLQGRLVDRRGLGTLLPLACVHGAGLVLVWVLGAAGAPIVAVVASSFLAGAAIPPLSSVLRSRWPYLLERSPDLIPGAYALDSVMIEFIFIVGPLIVTAIVATAGPEYALGVSAACVLSGTVLLLAGLRGRSGPGRQARDRPALGLGALAAPGLRTLVLASLPVGFCFGAIEVVLPAFSESEGSKELAGVLLAVWSAASGAAGLVYGARVTRAPVEEMHLRFACLLPLGIAALLVASSPLTMALLAILAGIPIAPLIASRNQLVGRVSLPGTATEAFTWPLTALVAGVSLGAATAGALVESYSWTAAVLVAVAVAAVGAGVLFARRGTIARPVTA
jgi:MFS family permease